MRTTNPLKIPSYFLRFFYKKKKLQSGGTSRWRFCYQRDLTRLDFFNREEQLFAVIQVSCDSWRELVI